jgi:flagellar basal body P-ring formation protein FlgA
MNRTSPTASAATAIVAAVILATAALVASAGAAFGQQPLVKVREAACVQGPKVVLGEIADPLSGLPPEQWERFSTAVLWDSPPADKGPVSLSRATLAALFKQHLGGFADALLLPGTLLLQGGGRVFRADELQRKVVEYLTPLSAQLGGEVVLRDFRLPDAFFVQSASGVLHLELARPLQPGRNGLRLVQTDAYNRKVRSSSASVFVDVWATVACAARPLNRREQIGPADVTFARKNLAYLRGPVWDGKGLGMRMTAPVGEGQVLYADALEPAPMVRKGDQVSLVFRGSAIHLDVPAQALSDGGYGQSIAVLNLATRRTVQARVLDERTVVVN